MDAIIYLFPYLDANIANPWYSSVEITDVRIQEPSVFHYQDSKCPDMALTNDDKRITNGLRMWCSKGYCSIWESIASLAARKQHDDVIKWKHFPRYWPFVRGIHRSPVNSPHKGQWRGALMFSLMCVWINGWVNNREAGDLRHYRAHHDVTVMIWEESIASLAARKHPPK